MSTQLPSFFSELPATYCSLGQDLQYYERLRAAGNEIFEPYFRGLRDVAIHPEFGSQLIESQGFRESLLRFSEAEKAFREAASLFTAAPTDRLYTFTFRCKVPGAESPHEVKFDFSEHPTQLHRTTVIIGRNGSGKTQFLARFAQYMSGLQAGTNGDQGFSPRRPSFSRVIAVSYSVFDDFTRPPESSRTFSYKYCGIRTPDPQEIDSARTASPAGSQARFLAPQELRERLIAALDLIKTQQRESRWREIIALLLEVTFEAESINNLEFYDRLSSGQRILVAILTEIVAHIASQSVILFDEPELHLHPEMFSALARAFDHLLKEFDSYAIIATHSSLLLQETLSRQVRIFRRQGNFPIVDALTAESFGENFTNITQEVFAVNRDKLNFREYLRLLLANRTAEEVQQMFPAGLPLQAQAYLRALRPRGEE